MIKWPFLCLLLGLLSSPALLAGARRDQILKVINEEISEVQRLASSVKGKNPNHLLRLAELNLEKARIIQEIENERYLRIPPKQRNQNAKSRYFLKSRRLYQTAQKYGMQIVKRYKRYDAKGDVYFILGYNSKELGELTKAKKYFERAMSSPARDPMSRYKSQIALATIAYNENNYKKATPLYESALRKIKDKWWTKDSFNLAWCYYRTGKNSRAIQKMKEVFQYSKSKKYVDMRDAVARDIGLFYATSDRLREGLQFYRSLGIDFARHLTQLGERLSAEGKYTQAEQVLEAALKAEKDGVKKAEILSSMLDLYEKFGRERQHYLRSRQLLDLAKSKKVTAEVLSKLRYHSAKMGVVLQKQVASKTYVRLPKKRMQKALYAVGYFEISSAVSPDKRVENFFLQGETSYSVGKYPQALLFYNNSFELAFRQKNRKFQKLSVEAMLAVLNVRSFSVSKKRQYIIPIYEKYLAYDPKGKRSHRIYQRLFKEYFSRKDFDKSYSVLVRFSKFYPSDYKTQEAMLAQLMEYYRRKKDNDKIAYLVQSIEKGKFKVSQKYSRKIGELLTALQMNKVQKALQSGDKEYALKGYLGIYKDPKSTAEAKRNAAYNLAVLFYEVGSSSQSQKWAQVSLGLMTEKEIEKFEDSYLTISSYLFEKLQFESSALLSMQVLQKLCRSKKSSKKDQFFLNGSFIAIADHKKNLVQKFFDLAPRCGVNQAAISDVRFHYLDLLQSEKNWQELASQLDYLGRESRFQGKLIPYLHDLRTAYLSYGNQDLASKTFNTMKTYYQQASARKQSLPLEALNIMGSYELATLKEDAQRLSSLVLSFPEENFNKVLERKLAILEQMTARASLALKSGSGIGIIGSYAVLAQSYGSVSNEISTFRPTGKGEDYIKSFQSSMKDIANPLQQKAVEFRRTALRQMERDEVLTDFNTILKTPESYPVAIKFLDRKATLMDRGGKR